MNNMTTDQLPQVRTRGLDSLDSLGAGTEHESNRPKVLKKLTSPIGTRLQVSQWVNEDGSDGNVELRVSRRFYSKKDGDYRWENCTLKSEDLFFLARVIQAMADQGLLPMSGEIKF